MSLATVSIVGNLVKDPESVNFASGRSKTRIIVAVNAPGRANKGGDPADFYKVEAWGKLGELAATYLCKGSQVTVAGRLIFERWTDREGKERMTPLIEANQIAFPPRLKVVDNVSEMSSQETFEESDEPISDATTAEAIMDAQPLPVEAKRGKSLVASQQRGKAQTA